MKCGDICVPASKLIVDKLNNKLNAGNHIYICAGIFQPDPEYIIGEVKNIYAEFFSINIDDILSPPSQSVFQRTDLMIFQFYAKELKEQEQELETWFIKFFDLPTYILDDNTSQVNIIYRGTRRQEPNQCIIRFNQSDYDTIITSVPLYYNGL